MSEYERSTAARAKEIAEALANDRVLAEVVAADLAEDRIVAGEIAEELVIARKREARKTRALFVMFLAIGLLAAFAYINARDANDQLTRAQQQVEVAQEQNTLLLRQQIELKDDFDEASKRAIEERDAINRRAVALERFVLVLIARGDSPEAQAAREFLEESRSSRTDSSPSPSPSPPSPSSGSEPRPSPSPAPRPTPSPSPSPSATMCVQAGQLEVCLPPTLEGVPSDHLRGGGTPCPTRPRRCY